MSPTVNTVNEVSEKFKFFNNLEIISDYSIDVDYQKKFIFKEITEENELLQMFALRYFVYRYVNFIEPNENQLDIDCYDFYSTFLGAFEIIGRMKRLIGTVRIISGDEKSQYAEKIKKIVFNSDSNKLPYFYKRLALYPIAETFYIPSEYLDTFYIDKDNSFEKSSKPFEISRLAVLPEYWCSEARIELGLHDLIILDSYKSNPNKNIYIIATHPRTRRRYERLGFKIIPGTREQLYKNINKPAIAMIMNLENYLNILNPYSERCKFLFKSYMENGEFVRMPLMKNDRSRKIFHEQVVTN